jgi:hypothetical protein
MKDKFAVSMFGQKRLSREGGIEIVVKELCTRMARDGCQVTCYNRSGHHVSGAEYDNKIEYDGIVYPSVENAYQAGKLINKKEATYGDGSNNSCPPQLDCQWVYSVGWFYGSLFLYFKEE